MRLGGKNGTSGGACETRGVQKVNLFYFFSLKIRTIYFCSKKLCFVLISDDQFMFILRRRTKQKLII
jgi:hypothetical protein